MMKDKYKVNQITRNKKTDWINNGFYQSVIPILSQPAKSRNDVYGAGFLMIYEGKRYIISAKHVVAIDDPTILLTGINKEDIYITNEYFEKLGFNWIVHPEEDLAIIPYLLPKKFKRIANRAMIPKPNSRITIKRGDNVRHLGYGGKFTGFWSDTKKVNNVPSGVLGKIIDVSPNRINIQTPAHHGDSGGPLLLKIQNRAKLIGVITTTKVSRKKNNPAEGEYLHRTSAVPISLVYDLIKSKEMQDQLN